MKPTDEQLRVIEHPFGYHAVVRAVPGAGKTWTLVARVRALLERKVSPSKIRVVMFNKAVQEVFGRRLHALGISGVKVQTFDSLAYQVLKDAEKRGLPSKPLKIEPEGDKIWAREIYPRFRSRINSADEIDGAARFWKAHLIPPSRAAFPGNAALVEAYAALEEHRQRDGILRVSYADMTYLAIAALRKDATLITPAEHLLVDEFQDVNPGRMELLRYAVGPATAVMAVGDEDQAIYEWAGAYPRYFTEFQDHFPNLAAKDYVLSGSFRLSPAIARAATALIIHNVERAPKVVRGRGLESGRIELIKDVAATAREWIRSGNEPSEMAVLYRGRPDGAFAIAALAAAEIPMNTEDMEILQRGAGPDLAMAYLHFAASDEIVDPEMAWRVVRGPDRFIRKEAFQAQLERGASAGLLAVLRDAAVADDVGQQRRAINAMRRVAAQVERLRSASCAAAVLDSVLGDGTVEEQLRDVVTSDKALELHLAAVGALRHLLRERQVSVADAPSFVRDLEPTLGRSPDECVRVATIHKAKGLEWRAVVIAGMREGACPAESTGRVPGSVDEPEGIPQSGWLEQERRVFFVGLTRALEVAYLEVGTPPSSFLVEAGLLSDVEGGNVVQFPRAAQRSPR